MLRPLPSRAKPSIESTATILGSGQATHTTLVDKTKQVALAGKVPRGTNTSQTIQTRLDSNPIRNSAGSLLQPF